MTVDEISTDVKQCCILIIIHTNANVNNTKIRMIFDESNNTLLF